MCHDTHVEVRGNFVESVLSFHLSVGLGDQTQGVRLMVSDDTVAETRALYVAQASPQSEC